MDVSVSREQEVAIHPDPAIVGQLVAGRRLAAIWLGPRLFTGWAWLATGWTMTRGTGLTERPSGIAAICLMVAGIAVLLGLATGAAAFAAIVLGVGLDIAGPATVAVSVVLVLAWKSAGWLGLDRLVLPIAGAPWRGGFALTGSEWLEEPASIEKEITG